MSARACSPAFGAEGDAAFGTEADIDVGFDDGDSIFESDDALELDYGIGMDLDLPQEDVSSHAQKSSAAEHERVEGIHHLSRVIFGVRASDQHPDPIECGQPFLVQVLVRENFVGNVDVLQPVDNKEVRGEVVEGDLDVAADRPAIGDRP